MSPSFCSPSVWFSSHQPVVCSASLHQERALFVHGSVGGPASLGRRQPFCLPFTDWAYSLPLTLLSISSLLLKSWVGHSPLWSVTRACFSLRRWGGFRPKLQDQMLVISGKAIQDHQGQVSQPPHCWPFVVRGLSRAWKDLGQHLWDLLTGCQ